MPKPLKKLSDRHKEIILMRIKNKTYEEIENTLNVGKGTINMIMQDPLAKEYKKQILEERLESAKNILLYNAENAAETITIGCRDKDITMVNIKAAEYNLKAIGINPETKIKADINNNITIIDNIPDDEESDEFED